MSNVKVGDKIRIITEEFAIGQYEIGDEFTVKNVWENGEGVYVVDDRELYNREFEVIRNPLEVNADNVNHPSHYTQGGVEVIDIIAQITRGYPDGFHAYCVGNALKYLARAPYKHAEIDEDVRKAAKYIEFITDDKGAI